MKEPVSTITNLAYVFVGVYAGIHAPTILHLYTGITLVLLGVASAAYHGTLHGNAQTSDEIAMYLVFTALIAQAASVAFFPGFEPYMLAAAIMAGALLGMEWQNLSSFEVVPVLAILAVMANGFAYDWETAALATVFLATSIIVRQIGVQYALSGKRLIGDTLHGIYHIIAAAGLYLLATNS